MRSETKEVKSKSKVVGQATYNVYDNLQEAVENVGESKALELINIQEKTNALNQVRQAAVGKPSKSALKQKALAMISIEEFTSVAGDPTALDNLVSKKVAELEAEAAANPLPTADADEGEGEDDD